MGVYFFAVALVAILARSNGQTIDDCLRKDSISCLQMTLFRNARDLLNRKIIDLASGISLVRENTKDRFDESREMLPLETSVDNASDVMARQEAIENFLVRKTRDVVVESTLRWNVGQTARALANSVPNVQSKIANYFVEARGKGKKLLRVLVPLLVGLTLKMAAMAAVTYLGIGFLAKKAILASLISLIVSGYIGLKKLLAGKNVHNDVATYHAAPVWTPHSGGYPPIGASGWPAPAHSNHIEPSQLAYSSHKSS